MELLTLDFKKVIYFVLFLGTLNNYLTIGSEFPLETVSDDDLVNLIKIEDFVIAFFAKNDCAVSKKWEENLIDIKTELESLTKWVVKVVNSPMKKLYSPSKQPVIVFFRNGVPLLFDGPLDKEEMLNLFLYNKEPVVKQLTDETFEHLTQASSGATTGDWFIMFHSTDCVDCSRMGARWEAVGVKLKQRVNVANINKYTTGASTARRFNVQDVPEFIFFRQGKMYRYQIPKYDIQSFVSFATDWYKNARAERVPVPQSPFDDLTQMIADFLRGNPWIMKLGSICICVMIIVTAASKLLRKSEVPSQKKDK